MTVNYLLRLINAWIVRENKRRKKKGLRQRIKHRGFSQMVTGDPTWLKLIITGKRVLTPHTKDLVMKFLKRRSHTS